MKKLLLTLMIFALCGTQNLISEENKETDDSYWYRNDVEHNGMLLTLYYAKTTNQFLNNCAYTMKNELGLTDYNIFDAKKIYNNFISEEGMKKNYPKTYKYLMNNKNDSKDDAFNHKGYEYLWYGVPIDEYNYMIFVKRTINDTEYISICCRLYASCTYTFSLLTMFEQNL